MKLNRRKYLYSFLSVLITLFIYYKLFLNPILYEIDALSREMSTLEEDISVYVFKDNEIEVIRSNINLMEAILSENINSLPDNYDSHDIIYMLLDAHAQSLDRHSLIFLEPVSRMNYRVLPVRFSFSTDYYGLIQFLSHLHSLQARVSISNMQITSMNKRDNENLSLDDEGELVYNLDVEMTINFFVKDNEQ